MVSGVGSRKKDISVTPANQRLGVLARNAKESVAFPTHEIVNLGRIMSLSVSIKTTLVTSHRH
jgi:ABC-type hemin transport system ATPase subunit